MAGRDKGKAEDFARYKQYDYRAVSGAGVMDYNFGWCCRSP